MRVDSNTQGHRQWFYFSMKNEKPCTVKLNIYRFKKVYSLFQRGMKPYFRSIKEGKDWQPGGKHVKYGFQKAPVCSSPSKGPKTFVLSFLFTFTHTNDQVFISSGIPYTYSFLNKQLNFYRDVSMKNEQISFETSVLCRSMCGLDLPLVSANHPMSKLLQKQQKKYIIINARTHSGETSGSWVLDGFLSELTSNKDVSQWILNQNIEFKIIPMLNPDGVMIGNYRTGIIGDDFNRRFHTNRHQFYPEILALKKVVSSCKKDGQVELFLDLHGHSVLKNSFIYGPSDIQSSKFKMKNLAYHLLHNSKYFRLGSCKFNTNSDSKETARLYFQIQQKLLSFTCENSLGLFYSQNQTFQMLASDWQNFGKSLLLSMKDIYANKDRDIKKEIPEIMKAPIFKQVQKKLSNAAEVEKKVTKNAKNEKVYLNIQESQPSYDKSQGSQKKAIHLNITQYTQRRDEPLDLSEKKSLNKTKCSLIRKKEEESSIEGQNSGLKLRRKSEVSTTTRIIQQFMGKSKQLNLSGKNNRDQFCTFQRSISDNVNLLSRQISSAQQLEEQKCENYSKYQLEAIKQNFSEDYSSINDSDSSSDDLPDQQKNYILQYIKMNQKQTEELPFENRNIKAKSRELRTPKISRFRQIRFKSIEEINEETDMNRESGKNQIKKLKLEPHKFKDSTTKSLLNKYNQSILENQFDDPSIVSISQQKRLNQRVNFGRRTQKDPFILIHRKEKLGKPL